MKKTVLILTLSYALFSQVAIFVGTNAIAFPNDDKYQSKPEYKQNFHFGAGYDIDLALFNLQVGAVIANSSFSWPNDEYVIKQVQIPVLLRMSVFPFVIKPYIQGGITYNLLSAIEENGTKWPSDAVESGLIMYTIGAGVDIDLPIPIIPVMFVDARYNIGTKPFMKNDTVDLTKFNQFLLNVGVRL